MKTWDKMSAAEFGRTTGTQLDLLGLIEGDGYGTLDLLATVAEVVEVERADGALFGLGLVAGGGTDGALFSVVAA